MTVKEFFKGKAFTCIIVLMCILLVSGILLSVCWGFLEVTDEERFNRKINALYGGESVTSVEQDISETNTSVSGAKIQSVWLIEEKNDYLVQASSRGYGGDITCWVAVSMDDGLTSVVGIRKVIKYAVADSAELIGNIGDEIYEKFATEYEEGKIFGYGTEGDDQFIETGATHTMSAICNCVNGSVSFIKAFAEGGSVVDPYEDYTLRDYIDMDNTVWTVNGTDVSYTVATEGFGAAGSFTVTLTVGADKTVKDYTVTHNGSTTSPDYASLMDEAVLNGDLFNGKDLSFFTQIYGDGMEYTPVKGVIGDTLVTGATDSNYPSKSTYLCAKAAAFALANYDVCLTAPKGGN